MHYGVRLKMTLSRNNIYLIAGVGMIVGAFFAAANAIGSLFALIYFVTSTDFNNSDSALSNNLVNSIYANQSANLVLGIGSFLILFLGGRWMIRGPKLLDRWAAHNKDAETNPPASN